MNRTFVISDTWFNRPSGIYAGFVSDEYNQKIVSNWNETVDENDTVYILGGLGVGDMYGIFFQLKGKIVILNNFCTEEESDFAGALSESIARSIRDDLAEKIQFCERQILVLPDEDAVLSYLPLSDWYGKSTGTFCFHGLNGDVNMGERNISCSALHWNLTPMCINDVKENVENVERIISEM